MFANIGRIGLIVTPIAAITTGALAHGANDHVHTLFAEATDLGSALNAIAGLVAVVAAIWCCRRRAARH